MRTQSRIETTGKRDAYGRPVVGMGRRRPGGALTTAEHIGAHDEVLVGVERAPGTDEAIPPSRSGVTVTRRTGSMAVAGQGVADEDRIAGVVRQRAPRLVGQRDVAQRTATFEHERPVGGDRQEPPVARRIAGSPRAGGGQHRRMYPAVHPSMMADTPRTSATYWPTTP